MSDAQPDLSRLAELAGGLALHEHLCLIYDTQEQQLAAALPYLRTGLERGEKCFYVVDENTAAAVLDALRKGGTDVDHYLRTGALTITHKQETYLQQGRFDPDWMIGFLTQLTAEAGAARFSGLRTILGEMTWALGASNGTDKLIEYESKLNRFVRDHDARVICQYNRNRFSPELILGVIRTHPLVVYGGIVCKNPYYVPPDEFLKANQAAQEVERLLNNILAWERAQQALRDSEEQFRALFNSVQVGVVVSGPNAEVLTCNPAAIDLLGVTEEQLLGTTSFDPKWNYFYEDDSPCPAAEHPIPRAIATRQPVRNMVIGVDRPEPHDRVWLLVSAQPQIGSDGKVTRVICSFGDITERKRTEEALRRSEAYLAAGQRLSHTGSWALNVSSGELFWSQEAYRIFGFDPAKTSAGISETFLQRIHPEDRPKIEEGLKAAAIQKESYGVDYRIVLPDGSLKYIHDVVYPVTNEAGDVVERYGVIMDVTDRRRAEEALQRSRDQLRALAARLQTVREDERTRAAREIHDELGQALTTIKLEFTELLRGLPADELPASQRSQSILKLLDEAIQSIRRIATELRPGILDDLGLAAAVEWVAEEFQARTGAKVQVGLPGVDIAMDRERATALFRILQETLTNVARHANATQVDVRLAKENGHLTLEVHDNGKGISEEELSAGGSLGILGMRERALLLGGELTFSSAPGKGTTVRARIPDADRDSREKSK